MATPVRGPYDTLFSLGTFWRSGGATRGGGAKRHGLHPARILASVRMSGARGNAVYERYAPADLRNGPAAAVVP